jgi:hypothetical protein
MVGVGQDTALSVVPVQILGKPISVVGAASALVSELDDTRVVGLGPGRRPQPSLSASPGSDCSADIGLSVNVRGSDDDYGKNKGR